VRGAWAAVALIVGWGFIGAGLFAWARRPENSVGALMAATGFAWFVGLISASNVPVLFTVGSLLGSVFFVTAVHMLLAAPHGRGLSRGDRRIVVVGYLVVTVAIVPLFLFLDPAKEQCDNCPENVLLIEHSDAVVGIWGSVINVVGLGLIVAVLLSLIRRWRRATRPERRLYAPTYAAGVALMIALIAQLGLQTAGSEGSALDVVFIISVVPLALVPYLFVASFVRARMFQGGAVGELMARLSEAPRPGGLRDALADALDDPSVELVFWLPERGRFVDGRGHEFELPEGDPTRDVVRVEREGVVRLLEEKGFDVVAQAGDAEDLIRKVNAHKPDVAVVDIRMPPTNTDDGLRAALQIRASLPDTGVLVLSQYVEEGYALELVGDSAGGVGYLLKDRVADVERFVDSVRRVAEGGSALDPEVVAQLVGRARRDDPLAELTPREREVLELMAEGRSNNAIAEQMVVTERAVEKHVTSIFVKLGLAPAPEDHRRVLAVLAFLRA